MNKILTAPLIVLLLIASTLPAWAGAIIDLKNSNGTVTNLKGTNGAAAVTQDTTSAGEDVPTDVQKVEQRFTYLNITLAAPTTTIIKSAPGFLHAIVVNKATALGVITCYDNTAASGTVIATITQPAALLQNQIQMPYDVVFGVGLTCVTSTAAQDITVSYR